jgi:hypothetical protein
MAGETMIEQKISDSTGAVFYCTTISRDQRGS